jgi:hypothetical protein
VNSLSVEFKKSRISKEKKEKERKMELGERGSASPVPELRGREGGKGVLAHCPMPIQRTKATRSWRQWLSLGVEAWLLVTVTVTGTCYLFFFVSRQALSIFVFFDSSCCVRIRVGLSYYFLVRKTAGLNQDQVIEVKRLRVTIETLETLCTFL